MAKQEIRKIKIEKLCLWSENPRDPINIKCTDYEIIKQAVEDKKSKWNLQKMLKEMGNHYDFSEIPTIVEVDGKYVVYDGNRRLAVLKYLQSQKLYSSFGGGLFFKLEPKELRELKEIPCNICSREIALDNIERKHINNGSWGALERDYFLFEHRRQKKSIFLMFEEATGLISKNNKLNQGFVKKEVLTDINLKDIGFRIENDKLVSIYEIQDTKEILNKLVELIKTGKISTRNDSQKGSIRVTSGNLKTTIKNLDPAFNININSFDEAKAKKITRNLLEEEIRIISEEQKKIRKTSREKGEIQIFFGKELVLKKGDTNSIYMDILDLHNFYLKNIEKLSKNFPAIIRMILRLLVESATSENQKIADYVNKNFSEAKKSLTQDQKTTLSNNNITEAQNLIQLLQSGAHDYANSANFEQTIAMSIIIGAMLNITHLKSNKK